MFVISNELNKKDYHNAVYDFSDSLYRFSLKLCRDESMAKDLVQDAFEKVWIKHKTIDATKVKSYLFRTVHNKFIDSTRKSRIISIDEIDEPFHYQEAAHDLKEVLNHALNKLSDVQKSAVLLRDYEGYKYAEIGEILNLKEAQVKVYIFRARKHLQKYIGEIEAVI